MDTPGMGGGLQHMQGLFCYAIQGYTQEDPEALLLNSF